jgi:hypothetical protein
MSAIRELLGETGDLSMMRVMSLLALLTAIVLAFTGHDSSVVLFLTASFGGKISQKYIENNTKDTDASIK